MVKAKAAKKAEFAGFPIGIGELMAPQAVHFWQAQQKALIEFSRYSSRCIDRRHKAVSAILDEQWNADLEHGDAPATLPRWQSASMEMMAEEVSDWLTLWSTYSNLISQEEINAECEILGLGDGKKDADKLPTRIPV